jgi:hypothetical protein
VVDRSLETLAADRGVTIVFADLDGVEGLWLPDERTILVSRRLSDRQAADVLDHELSHVDIEDGHAALDAAVRARTRRTKFAIGLSAAAITALLLGIRLLVAGHPVTAPDSPQAGQTARGQSEAPQPTVTVPVATTPATQVFGRGPQARTVTVTVRATTPSPTPSPAARSAAATVTQQPTATARSIAPPSTSQPQPTLPTSSAPVPTTDPGSPTPSATEPAATTAQAPVDVSPQG